MVQNDRKNTEDLSVSLPKELKRDILEFSEELDIPVSKVAKDALESYILRRRWDEIQRVFGPAARKLGIKTDEDVERFFG